MVEAIISCIAPKWEGGEIISAAEKRRYHRFAVPLPVECQHRLAQDGAGVFTGQTQDVSLSGLRLQVKGRDGFEIGDPLEVSIDTLRLEGCIRVMGQVRWIQAQKENAISLEMGVHVTEMAAQDWNVWYRLLPSHLG